MSIDRVGAAFRTVRLRKNWTQADLARRAGVSRWAVVQAENGRLGRLRYDVLERIARSLDGTLETRFRWRGEEQDRLLNRDHSLMHERVAQLLGRRPDWDLAPEVSFAIYGERGVIDILAFHRPTRRLLVIELKTLIVDVQALLGTTDRYRRLAMGIARERGWDPVGVSLWVLVADTRTNRRRIALHRTVLRSALPTDGRTMRHWLTAPTGDVAALSTLVVPGSRGGGPILAGRKRASPRRRAARLRGEPGKDPGRAVARVSSSSPP